MKPKKDALKRVSVHFFVQPPARFSQQTIIFVPDSGGPGAREAAFPEIPAKKARDMKRLATMLLLMAAIIGLKAQTTVTLGYCAGEATDKGTLSTEGKAWVSGAIYLPADMLAAYKGSKITKLRAALASKTNIDTLHIWVRTDLKGDDLKCVTFNSKTTPKLAKGWNEATLDEPLDVPEGQGLYIGMSFRQKATVNGLSIVGSPLENGCFVKLGDDAKWEQRTDVGILSIEAEAEASSVPDYDVGIASAMANPYADAAYTQLTVTVVNNGLMPISGFTLNTRYEQSDEVYEHHFDTQLAWGQKDTVSYQVPALSTVTYGEQLVSLASIDDGTDAVSTNNSIRAKQAMKKKVLIEEFTTEPCGNCPRVAGYLHTALGMEQFRDRAVAVCHHSGYKTDWLTKSCDEKLAGRFGVGYAPAMMFDRKPIFAGDLHMCPEFNDIVDALTYTMAQPAHVTINFSAAYDDELKQLTITVSGKRDDLNMVNPCLTVYLLEDNVKAVNQANGGSNFYHKHVIRAFNSDYGEPIQWNGNQYEHKVVFDVDDSWVKDNMQIVAFVGNYDKDNNKNCNIDNAEQTGFPMGEAQAVEAVTSGEGVKTEYFSADGRRLSAGQKGLIIVRKTGAAGKVVTYKMIAR